MNSYLLDTHVLLWCLSEDKRLGSHTLELLSDIGNRIFVSAVSTWEISIKQALGKLDAPKNIETIILDQGFTPLEITLSHGQNAGELPFIHHDPFDRMLIAQAQNEDMILLTCDSRIIQYNVQTLFAGN